MDTNYGLIRPWKNRLLSTVLRFAIGVWREASIATTIGFIVHGLSLTGRRLSRRDRHRLGFREAIHSVETYRLVGRRSVAEFGHSSFLP